jgi:DNA-binding HxlR family transcriptional regulator
MRSKGFDGMVCSIAGVMAALGDRWGLLILRDLVIGLSRYEDFRQSSGVTNATLSDRLKHLEANGLVERRRYQVNPERFEYLLTQRGWQLAPLMPVLAQIGDHWDVSGVSAPPMRFVNRKTGADVGWRFVDQDTGEQVSPQDLAIKEGPGADDLVRWRLSRRSTLPQA